MKIYNTYYRRLYGKSLMEMAKELNVSYVTVSTYHKNGDLKDKLERLKAQDSRKFKPCEKYLIKCA